MRYEDIPPRDILYVDLNRGCAGNIPWPFFLLHELVYSRMIGLGDGQGDFYGLIGIL
jgi:hypothetical protein